MAKRTKLTQQVVRKPLMVFGLPVAVFGLLVALALAVTGFGGAAVMEENDAFCASCHTQPESTFYARLQQPAPVDLAAAHDGYKVKCIDCHSGGGVGGRVAAIVEGSQNAVAYVTRTGRQPSQLSGPMGDDHCLKCHAEVYTQANFANHFHRFLPRWQAADPNAPGCAACHTSHTTDGSADVGFLGQTRTETVCRACHNALGE